MPLKMKSPQEIREELEEKSARKRNLDKRANAQKRSEEAKKQPAKKVRGQKHTVEELEDEETAQEQAREDSDDESEGVEKVKDTTGIPLQKGQSLILDGKIEEVELRCPNPHCTSLLTVTRTVGEFNLARGIVRCGRCKSILHRVA